MKIISDKKYTYFHIENFNNIDKKINYIFYNMKII